MTERRPLRILVTGSRIVSADAFELIYYTLRAYRLHFGNRPFVIVHGGARGTDSVAAQWASETQGVEPEPHPADWNLHGKAAGPIRNQEMVDLGADICLAFPSGGSIGTWDCLKRAALAGIPGRVHPLVGVA